MQSIIRTVAAAAALSAALGLSGGANAATPPPHSIDLGGANLTYWCQVTFGQNYISRLLGHTAGDWRCVLGRPGGHGGGGGGSYTKPISVQDACRVQYGKTGLIAYALNWSDPLSWRCFEPRGFGGHGHR